MRGRGAEIAGGLAVVGLVVLIVLSLTYRPSAPDAVVSTGDSILAPTPTSAASPSPTPSPSQTPEPTSTTTPAADDDEVEVIPEGERAGIEIQVVNGGAPDGSAGEMTQRLVDAAFAPRLSTNAVSPVTSTVILYAEGRQNEAATANTVIGAIESDVVPADSDNANWQAFGEGLDVLVVLGPGLP